MGQSNCRRCVNPTGKSRGTVLKESDDLVIVGVTFDSKATFEKHLRSVSRAASQRFGILNKSFRVFHDRSLLGRCFLGFVFPVLEYCSAVWCSAADAHLNLLIKQVDRVVSRTRFLTGDEFECDIADRRFVAVLCTLTQQFPIIVHVNVFLSVFVSSSRAYNYCNQINN